MRYNEQQKNDALKLADEIGAKKASEQLSISYQSLLAWRKRKAEKAVPARFVMAEEKKPVSSGKKEPSLETENQILRNEVAQLKKQLVKQANAIQALSKVDE